MYKYMYMYVLVLVGTLLVQQDMEWPLARDYCLSIGGHLLEAKTQAEFDEAIRITLEVQPRAEGYLMYLGGSDAAVEGEWRWASNGELIDMTRFWMSGQPNSDGDYLRMRSDGFHDSSISRTFACVKSIYWI